jgi:hypothetical protein
MSARGRPVSQPVSQYMELDGTIWNHRARGALDRAAGSDFVVC